MIIEPPALWEKHQPGFYAEVTELQYHGFHDAVSNSLLKKVKRSPAHAHARFKDDEVKPAFKQGRAIHSVCLTPDLFDKEYVAFQGDRRRKEGKDAYAALLASGYDEWTILKADEYEMCHRVHEAIYAHPITKDYIEAPGEEELSVLWETHGMLCKSRYDKYIPGGIIADIKTTPDASPDSWLYDAFRFGYDQQAAFYSRSLIEHGEDFKEFVFIAAEKYPPYGIAVYVTPPEVIKDAWRALEPTLERYSECLKTATFPSYPPVKNWMERPW